VLLIDQAGEAIVVAANDALAVREAAAVVRDAKSIDATQVTRRVGGSPWLMTAARVPSFSAWVLGASPALEVFGPLLGYRTWFWVLTGLTVALGGLFAAWISAAVRRPVVRLMEGFTKVEAGDLAVELAKQRDDEFGYLYDHFNAMVRSLDATMRRCVEQESLARHAELAQLQSQINPHFLYNSIYHIYRMAKSEDYESIERYALHLGSYYEFVTRSATDETYLEEEARHARNYVEVQRTRFRDRIRVDIADVPESICRLRVPRLIVQPLVENAYNHGLKETTADGVLLVRYLELGSVGGVTVEDNGRSLSDAELEKLARLISQADRGDGSPVSGIVNIHRRLRLRFGPSSGVRVERSSLGGLKVTLLVPLPEVK
jgi:two-component system sensor histidine kinase YesM